MSEIELLLMGVQIGEAIAFSSLLIILNSQGRLVIKKRKKPKGK
jgi:hypothetical protein